MNDRDDDSEPGAEGTADEISDGGADAGSGGRVAWYPDAIQASHPNVPRRGPVYLAFGCVVIAGVLGALIGYGLVGASCSERAPRLQQLLAGAVHGYEAHGRSCTAPLAGGTLFGGTLAAIGTGIVAMLMMRAMGDWRPPRRDLDEPGAD
jgi:hypothetical protein